MISTFRSARKQVEALIRRLAYEIDEDAVMLRTNALRAHSLAVQAGSRILEAEAILLLGRSYYPMLEPKSSLMLLQRAEQIFRVNLMYSRAAMCQVASARALLDLGQERNAIMMATAALSEVSLSIEYRVRGYAVMALSYGSLGDLDEAVKILSQSAIPLAALQSAEPLRRHVKQMIALTKAQLFLVRRYPRLWRGVPGLEESQVEIPTSHYVLSLLDSECSSLQTGVSPSYLEVAKQLILGLSEIPDRAIHRLSSFSRDSLERDPLVACLAMYCCGLIQRNENEPFEALKFLGDARGLAQRWGSSQLLREVTLQIALSKEELGDLSGALQAYKAFIEMRMLSLAYNDSTNNLATQSAGATNTDEKTHLLRDLEPRHVKKAIRFIEGNLHLPISVADVVEQIKVGRRTLEISFRESKSCTVAQYIKRRKLHRAALALRTTDQTVQDVALSVGYRWAAAFSRDFLAEYGVKPSAWQLGVESIRLKDDAAVATKLDEHSGISQNCLSFSPVAESKV